MDGSTFDAWTRRLARPRSRRAIVTAAVGGVLGAADWGSPVAADNACKPAGKKCNKSAQCCGGLICASGQCTDLCAGVVCTALDQCHVAGICDPTTGLCSSPTVADGTPCDDDNGCTFGDTCQAGICVGIEFFPGTGVVDCGTTFKCCHRENGVETCVAEFTSCDQCPQSLELCIRIQKCCCTSDADCEDGNPCTIDTCRPDGSCLSTEIECNA